MQTDSLTLRGMAVDGLPARRRVGWALRPMSMRFMFPWWAATAAFLCHRNSPHRSHT